MEKRKNMPMLEQKDVLPVAVHGLIQTAENLVWHGDLSVEAVARRTILQGCARQPKE